MQMEPNQEMQEIIDDFVLKATEEGTIESRAVVHVDFSEMSDEQIGQWLVGTAKLFDPRNGEIANIDVREAYEAGYMKEAWKYLVFLFLKLDPDPPDPDLYESKYSSFKNQQTITENFRRFLKK